MWLLWYNGQLLLAAVLKMFYLITFHGSSDDTGSETEDRTGLFNRLRDTFYPFQPHEPPSQCNSSPCQTRKAVQWGSSCIWETEAAAGFCVVLQHTVVYIFKPVTGQCLLIGNSVYGKESVYFNQKKSIVSYKWIYIFIILRYEYLFPFFLLLT